MGLSDLFKKKKDETGNFKTAEQRKRESIEKLKNQNIKYIEHLPTIEESNSVRLKDVDYISKKAIATLLVIQLAFDADNGGYNEAKATMGKLLKQFGAEEYLTAKERAVYEGKYTKQDLVNITWEYETYWALVWALGIIGNEEMESPAEPCDFMKAIHIVSKCKDYEEFKKKVNIRDIEETLDMLDLYYRYNWATVDHLLRPNEKIGINHEVVVERRKGLEWLVSDLDDWDEISLDT